MASEGGCILIQKQTLKQNMKYLVFCDCQAAYHAMASSTKEKISGLILAPAVGKLL